MHNKAESCFLESLSGFSQLLILQNYWEFEKNYT